MSETCQITVFAGTESQKKDDDAYAILRNNIYSKVLVVGELSFSSVATNGHTKSSLRQQKDVFNHFKAHAAVQMDGLYCILVSMAAAWVSVEKGLEKASFCQTIQQVLKFP